MSETRNSSLQPGSPHLDSAQHKLVSCLRCCFIRICPACRLPSLVHRVLRGMSGSSMTTSHTWQNIPECGIDLGKSGGPVSARHLPISAFPCWGHRHAGQPLGLCMSNGEWGSELGSYCLHRRHCQLSLLPSPESKLLDTYLLSIMARKRTPGRIKTFTWWLRS